MKSNLEYVRIFAKKHGYSLQVELFYQNGRTPDYLKYVKFDKKDIPIEDMLIDLDDIKYDVESEHPKDLFFRWVEYCEKNEKVGYKYWVTKMNNKYQPMDVDKSDMDKFINDIENSLGKLKVQLIKYRNG